MQCGVESCDGDDHGHLGVDADDAGWQIGSPRRQMQWVEAEPVRSGGGGCWERDGRLKREGLQLGGGRGGEGGCQACDSAAGGSKR